MVGLWLSSGGFGQCGSAPKAAFLPCGFVHVFLWALGFLHLQLQKNPHPRDLGIGIWQLAWLCPSSSRQNPACPKLGSEAILGEQRGMLRSGPAFWCRPDLPRVMALEKGCENSGSARLKELLAGSACGCARCYSSLFSLSVLCVAGAVFPKFSIFLWLGSVNPASPQSPVPTGGVTSGQEV